ncbi:MAG: toll/interleukin-1 receptor domain-containing protein [Saprospiraceae bacterium]|nr:toll/interleukin-1 receptor domain-containing protein [Saprospiraceae bacterium]
MTQAHPRIYISHAWGGESEHIVREVVRVFDDAGLSVIYDKKDLGYRESIRDFMVNLGQADIIIIVVSNKYLHSEYCMFELLQIYDNNRVLDRIFPIVLEEVQIAKSTERLELVKYWEEETKQLEEKIRELGSIANIEGISDDLNLYQTIRNRIARLTAILKDINTLNIQIHRKSDYRDLLAAVKQKLEASTISQELPEEKSYRAAAPNPPATNRKKWSFWPWVVTAAMVIVAFAGFKWWAPGATAMDKETPMEVTREESDMEPALEVRAPEKDENPDVTQPEREASSSDITEQSGRKSPVVKKEVQVIKTNKPQSETITENFSSVPTIGESVSASPEFMEEQPLKPAENNSPARTVDLFIPKQMIRVVLSNTLSSERNREGDEVELTCLDEVKIGPYSVIRPGAAIRGEVTKATSALTRVKGELAFRIKDVRTEDGQWLELSYPEYSDSRRGEVTFPKGTELANIVLKEARLTWTPER